MFFFVLIFAVVVPQSWAHEDVDIGIEDVQLNKQCLAEVTLVNKGRYIPPSFYRLSTPASLSIEKAGVIEQLGSISTLDKYQKLRVNGGRLKVISKKSYSSMPQPMNVSLSFFGEYFDHGGENNTLQKEIDCELGKGQIIGMHVFPTQPDVAISDAYIQLESCTLMLEVKNLTGIELKDESWERGRGIILMRLNLDNSNRLPNIDFIDVDPHKKFSKTSQTLLWESAEAIKGIHSLRVGLWQVQDDLNFQNNMKELSLPESCW